ncbi:DUF5131 family protein [Desulfovibrio aerotolerans]|uniref:DUF5131 family protein n=1 Tax=Solidesulfovibrio aerotolerans TaxID=295255 RepID=A0A7C9ML65_9BACT|nr:phage Gp37/Gp68 family protein [Solidesulfovibrio aerotolerans]MYL85228.1 DUF5131 family protein [Solidesulfovibrio aerotolerans]
MSSISKIGWTDASWNPTTGCTQTSPGCKNCYAETTAKKLHGIGFKEYDEIFSVKTHLHKLYQPLNWKKGKRILVNSMGDLLHPAVPDQFIYDVFGVMNQATQHTFQLLTKYSDRLVDLSARVLWSNNIWAGVSVENQDYCWRISHLKTLGAKHRFIAFEPLIGPISDPDFNNIDWVIIGGESAKYAREMKIDWVRTIRDACVKSNVPFHFARWDKQNAKRLGRTLDGVLWDQIPK